MNYSDKYICKQVNIPTASDYQLAIFRNGVKAIDAYLSNENVSNTLVEAVAGSGKTTTIVGFAHLIPKKIKTIFLAFNKAIAVELDQRLPNYVESRTLNSLGFRILLKFAKKNGEYINIGTWTQSTKTWTILKELYDYKQLSNYGKHVAFLVSKAKTYGIVPAELEFENVGDVNGTEYHSANGLRDVDQTWKNILNHFDHHIPADIFPTVINMVRKVLTYSIINLSIIDFDDQKYLPVVIKIGGCALLAKKYDAIIIDEVQDLNAIDILLVKMSLNENGIVMGVGDRNQGIYGFRGAANNAMDAFSETFNCQPLPLSISYRCAKAIVELAKTLYPVIEASPTAADGKISHHKEYGATLFNPANEDMVLCRNNAPLIGFAYYLIRNRVPVFVKGREIGRDLVTLIKAMKQENVIDLCESLGEWLTRQMEIIAYENPDDESAIQRITDKYETIGVFISENTDGRVETVIREIESMFSTSNNDKKDEYAIKGCVILSTIHKAKGLEAHTVFLLDSHLMYPKWIKEDTWQEVQERNLEYVGITRAKMELNYIKSSGKI